MSRVTAQLYDLLGIFLAPAIFSAKVLMSRVCKITSSDELETPIIKIDPELANLAFTYLTNLKKIDQIKPFPGSFIPGMNKLISFVVFCDGGLSGFACAIYILSLNPTTDQIESRLCFASGMLGKKKYSEPRGSKSCTWNGIC